MSPVPAFAYRYRGALVAIPPVVALVTKWHQYENDAVAWTVAVLIFSAGFGLRIWAQQHLHFRLKMKMNLTSTGPYVLTRNPIYIANTLICLAVTVASEALWMLPITLLNCCLVFHFVVKHEEHNLLKKYGDQYAEYLQQVPRWLPQLSALSKINWSPAFLAPSIKAEAYNLLFLVPPLLKELLTRNA